MNWKRFLCAGISAALLAGALAGCGTEDPAAATPDPDDVAYQAAGITRDTVLFTVDGTDVPADEYLYWLLQSISTAKGYGYLADDTAWEEEIDGVPTADYLKQAAQETSVLYTTMANHAAEAGITVTEEEQAEVEASVEQMETQLAASGMTFQDILNQQCISMDAFLRMNDVYYLAMSYQQMLEDSGELTPTDEDMQAMLEEAGLYRCEHILLAFPENEDGSAVTDEQKAATKAEADALLAEILAADDPAAAFETAMNERSDDGRDESGALYAPDGYTFDASGYLIDYSGVLVSEFVEAGMALEVGEISQPVETDYGYHILMRVDADTDETRALYASYAFSQLNDQWVEQAVVETTAAYDALDPKAFYDNMVELIQQWQEELETAQAAESTAPEETQTPADSAEPAEE